MKPANKWIQFGRILGTIPVIMISVAIFPSIIPSLFQTNETALVIYFIQGLVYFVIFSILLIIAWLKEILGGLLYLILGVVGAFLLIPGPTAGIVAGSLLLVPMFATGILFLIGGLQKKRLVETV